MRNELLYKGFENIPSRKGRGGTYQYVRWQDVADRMNEVFGLSWGSEIMFQDVVGDNIVVRVRVMVTDPDSGKVFYQEGFGGAKNDELAEAGNPFKAAYSKALKDACKKWGVGLNLEEDSEVYTTSSNQVPSGYMGKEVGVPPAPSVPKTQPAFVPNAPPVVPPPAEEKPQFPVDTPQEAKNFPEPTTFVPEPPSSGGMPLPPGVKMSVSSDTVIKQELPSTPAPPTMNLSAGEKPLGNKATTINNGDSNGISDVQKAALHSILSIKEVDYESLVREAFAANGINKTPIPPPDDLTYQEAVYVVKYGNDKFRRR